MRISSAIEGFFLDRKLGFAKTTTATYKIMFRQLAEFLNDAEFENVTTRDVRRFLNHLEEPKEQGGHGLSKRSIHDYWIALSSLWTWGQKELEVPHVIRGKIPAPKFTKKIIEPFKPAQIKKLIAATELKADGRRRSTKLRDVAIIHVLLDSGVRSSELCAFCVRDYDAETGKLLIRHGKGDKQRNVILGNRGRKSVWRYLTSRPDASPNDPLFPTASGEPLRHDNLRHMLNAIGKNAGVEHTYPHRFRHTFAISFLRNGGNLFVLQELLGHESLEMVRYYSRLAESDIDDAAAFSVADRWKI